MKPVCLPLVPALLAALLLLSPSAAEEKKETAYDADALAKTLVTQCARIKDGDIVQIMGGTRDAALLECLTVQVAKAGGDPLLLLSVSDRTSRRLVLEVPEKFDSRTSPSGLKLADIVNASIAIDSTDSDSAMLGIPASRLNARYAAGVKIYDRMLARGVRQVFVGSGLYPTETRAKQYGITRAELEKMFVDGMNVNYEKMQASGEEVRKALAGGKKVQITTPEGTNLTMEVAERPVNVSDGILSDERVKKGGVACQVWLPAGEVYLAPVKGTAEGKVAVERMLWEGKEIQGLTLTFRKGKLTEMTAKKGLERLKAMYDTAGERKDEFAFLDVGINPAVRLPKSSPAGLFMEAGTITVGFGSNAWAGGDNNLPFGVMCYLKSGTLKIDGKALVEDGAIKQ